MAEDTTLPSVPFAARTVFPPLLSDLPYQGHLLEVDFGYSSDMNAVSDKELSLFLSHEVSFSFFSISFIFFYIVGFDRSKKTL